MNLIFGGFLSIVNQFSLSCALHGVSELATCLGANCPQLTLGLANSPE